MPKGNINGIFERCQVALTRGQRVRDAGRRGGGGDRRKRQHAKEQLRSTIRICILCKWQRRESELVFSGKKATFQEAAKLKEKVYHSPSPCLPLSLCVSPSLPLFLRFLYRKICYCLLSYDLYGRSGKKATAATSTKNRNLSPLKMGAVAVGGVR